MWSKTWSAPSTACRSGGPWFPLSIPKTLPNSAPRTNLREVAGCLTCYACDNFCLSAPRRRYGPDRIRSDPSGSVFYPNDLVWDHRQRRPSHSILVHLQEGGVQPLARDPAVRAPGEYHHPLCCRVFAVEGGACVAVIGDPTSAAVVSSSGLDPSG